MFEVCKKKRVAIIPDLACNKIFSLERKSHTCFIVLWNCMFGNKNKLILLQATLIEYPSWSKIKPIKLYSYIIIHILEGVPIEAEYKLLYKCNSLRGLSPITLFIVQ